MTTLLLDPLNHLNGVAQQLFRSLSPPHTKPPPPPPLAYHHQKRQQRIEALKTEVLALEDSWRTVIMQLEQGRRDLEAIISEGEARLDAIEQAKAGAIPYPELLAYAQSLSAFTSAPPNLPDLLLPGQPPPPLFFPPFPNEEKMRRGHLNAEEPLGLLGETHSVGRPPSPSPEGHRGQVANPYRPVDSRPQQAVFDLDLDLNPDL
ncbi:vitamin-D-receptor interacting mediator subunit 4-domain-containing protein [Russula earlei]|uniref:Vitamin-D-receptor interacting mediator subunit 4-domain-containing protein n=1 Tax=Russula earlei TaxID=71964 RepID=A0ACC0UG78_9AGAM|nr:vitamin-D-receptor interacting mediator subunit 4-domain-containing protein [Russula earlei]